MINASPEKIRNVVLIGHGGSGKTTLTEALLHLSGAIARKGRVEDGTTVSDFEPEEVKRHMSVSMSLASLDWQGYKVNLIDTPGFVDFIGEVELALDVADVVVVVVSAVEGVEVQTEAVWRLATQRGLPRVIFVNKLDRERADFDAVLEGLRQSFGGGVAPLELPIGSESGFRGVADLLADEAIIYQDGKRSTGPIPDEMAELEHRVSDNLVEGIVVADDALMERYLEGDVPSAAELEVTLANGVASGDGLPRPVRLGGQRGRTRPPAHFRLRDPTGANGPRRAGDQTIEVADDPDGQCLARVFKTTLDPFVGRISFLASRLGHDPTRRRPRQHPHPHRGAAARPSLDARQRGGTAPPRRRR